MAGKRKANDIRNELIYSYIEFIRLVEPKMIFFENIHGFTLSFNRNTRKKPYSEILKEELTNMGYTVEGRVLLMSDYGIPQRRKRFILFGIKEGNPEEFFESLNMDVKKFLKTKKLNRNVRVKEAIGDLERVNGEILNFENRRFKDGLYGSEDSSYKRYMRKEVLEPARPDSHRFANQKRDTVELLQEIMKLSAESIRITPGHNMVKGLKKRSVTALKEDTVCPTLTSIPDDLIHYKEPGIMTVREYARIQSFPDDFLFKGRYTTGGKLRRVEVPRYTQVANAVPPLFTEQVGIILRKLL